jgi:hypothetical protein
MSLFRLWLAKSTAAISTMLEAVLSLAEWAELF